MSSDEAPGVHTEAPSSGDAGAAAPEARRRSSSFTRELPLLLLVAFVLALLIKAFLVQAFYIPSGSMQQTLELRDRVLVNKLVYDFRDVHRGEIVVFDGEGSFTEPEFELAEPTNPVQRALQKVSSVIGLGAPGEKDFIKRVIGLPGDRVACCTNGHVTVQPAGSDRPVELTEPYVFSSTPPEPFCEAGDSAEACPPGAPGVLVPEGRLFVMGDHRDASRDSRAYLDDGRNGTVPIDKVIGRAFVILWPLDRAEVLEVPDTFDGPLSALGPGAALGTGAPLPAATPLALGVVGAVPVVALRRRVRRRSAARRAP